MNQKNKTITGELLCLPYYNDTRLNSKPSILWEDKKDGIIYLTLDDWKYGEYSLSYDNLGYPYYLIPN